MAILLKSLNVVYKDRFIPLADPEETLGVVCVIRELMTEYSSCNALNFKVDITYETAYIFWCSRCTFIPILTARNRLVFMIEGSQKGRTDTCTR
jgi:hypothetical protein